MPHQDADGVIHMGQANLGEAWQRGPVVLSWDATVHGAVDPKDGHNLVLHEFAHKLDMLDGLADGTPPLDDKDQLAEWVRVMSREYEQLQDDAQRGRATVMGHLRRDQPGGVLRRRHGSAFSRRRAS